MPYWGGVGTLLGICFVEYIQASKSVKLHCFEWRCVLYDRYFAGNFAWA